MWEKIAGPVDEDADREIDKILAKRDRPQSKRLFISVEYSEKDQCFVARIVDRNIMISDDGQCISEAVKNLVPGLEMCEPELNEKYGKPVRPKA